MSNWIDVEDKLPEAGQWHLAYSDGQIEILFFDSEHPIQWLQHGDWLEKVTHWMPLPSPPKAKI